MVPAVLYCLKMNYCSTLQQYHRTFIPMPNLIAKCNPHNDLNKIPSHSFTSLLLQLIACPFTFQDTLLLSLHNFLSLVFARLPAPRLSEFQSTSTKLKRLREENEVLRQTLIKQRQQAAAAAAAASSEKLEILFLLRNN